LCLDSERRVVTPHPTPPIQQPVTMEFNIAVALQSAERRRYGQVLPRRTRARWAMVLISAFSYLHLISNDHPSAPPVLPRYRPNDD
jgi:hypothetical protein